MADDGARTRGTGLLTRRGSDAELITTVGVVLAVQAGAQDVWGHAGISLVAGLLAAIVVTTAWAVLSRRGRRTGSS